MPGRPEAASGGGRPSPPSLVPYPYNIPAVGMGKVMGATPTEYDVVIADLEDQILELQTAIEVLKRQRDKGPSPQGMAPAPSVEGVVVKMPVVRTPVPRTPALEPSIPSDAFFGMSLVDATKKYLGILKKPQGTKAIVDALERGRLQHSSKSLYSTLFTVLTRRASKDGDIVKIGLEWGLTEWYPGLRRKVARREEQPEQPSSEEAPEG